jgi:methyl-accepting chemotaxis protein
MATHLQDSPSSPSSEDELPGKTPVAIKRALLNAAERERLRGRLLGVVLATLALIFLLLLPGYLLPARRIAGIIALGALLGVVLIAWFCKWIGSASAGAYAAIIGQGVVTGGYLTYAILHNLTVDGLLTSLLFIPIIIEAGLLLSPEGSLLTALLILTLSGLALPALIPYFWVDPTFLREGLYLFVTRQLMVQVAAAVLSWLIARRVRESIQDSSRVAELELTQARMEKQAQELAEQHRLIVEGIAIIQQTHARVAGGDYGARAHITGGELMPLAISLNLMLERVEAFVAGERERSRLETVALSLAEVAGRVSQGNLVDMPMLTGTALDGLAIALGQMQGNLNRRLLRVRQSAEQVVAAVARCQDGLRMVAEVIEEHVERLFTLSGRVDALATGAAQQRALLARLSGHADQRPSAGDELAIPSASALAQRLQQLATTTEFAPAHAATERPRVRSDATPPLAAAPPPSGERETSSPIPADTPLVEALLRQSLEHAQTAHALSKEIDMVAQGMRQADMVVAWLRGAIEATMQASDQLRTALGAFLLTSNVLPERATSAPTGTQDA